MKVTAQLIEQFGLPEESLGGFYFVHFERVKDVDPTAPANVATHLTGRCEAKLELPNGSCYQAESKLHPKDKYKFSKRLSHTIVVNRIKHQMHNI
jgi:hypothetical protein